jgi:DNA helicase-2/ATP-dependent DNA helicase PcrA
MNDGEWQVGLDDAQRTTVEHGADPLVIAAGAGTGKTRVLTARVARLLEAGVAPERVLLLTFTRRAAAAMTERAAAQCGDPSAAGRVWSGTFHAVAHRIVAEHTHHLGLEEFSVLDADDVIDLLDLMRAGHGLVGTEHRLPTTMTLADIGSRAVNTGVPTREVMAEQFPWALEHADAINALLRAYAARKRERGLLDFDDLLLYWRALLADPEVGARLRARWDWVLVDEYQDVNQIQVDIVRGLRPDGTGLTVVGDDAQAIYGFRGASAGHLFDLARSLPTSTMVRLERNFRSTQEILDLANVARPGELELRLRADRDVGRGRPQLHHCENADDEARGVAEAVLAAQTEGVPLREQAVLMRTGTHSAQLEIELRVRDIPFVKYGGIGYLETAHVRDLLAAFRVATNPADEVAWYRLLTRHRSIGKATARAIAPMLAGGVTDALDTAVAAAPNNARTRLEATLRALADAEQADRVTDVVEACHGAVQPLVRQHYADWSRRVVDVDRLAEAAARQPDLRSFVAEQTIDPASVSADWAKKPYLDEDYLILSTIHSAKGLEWDVVHLLRACDGALPSDMALTSEAGLAEEQRLFYVALTRARDHLHVHVPARLPTHPTSFNARHVLTKPSRFLSPEAVALMTTRYAADARSSGAAPAPRSSSAPRVTVDTMDHLFA